MGLDYRYLLFFERDAHLAVLERLADMAAPAPDGPTDLVLTDRTVTLPFSVWAATESSGGRIAWDDPSPAWDFMTVLCFEPDEAIESYAHTAGYDDRGRAEIGIVYLTVQRDMRDWPSDTDDDLVLFDFNTPGSTMSVLFWESESIRRAFTDLLASCHGVYGLLDMEDIGADLFWLRGETCGVQLPTGDMSLAEIETFIRSTAPTDVDSEAFRGPAGAPRPSGPPPGAPSIHAATIASTADRSGRAMTFRERFTDEEWQLVARVPFDAFLVGAMADGEVEPQEVEAFTQTLRRAGELKDPLHREIAHYWVSAGMGQPGEESTFPPAESDPAIDARMARTKRILQGNLTRQEYQGFFKSIWLNAADAASRSRSQDQKTSSWWRRNRRKTKRKEEDLQPISDREAVALAAFAADWEIDLSFLADRTS